LRLAAAALVAGLLYLGVALTGLGATALAHAAPEAINLAGHAAPSGPPITAAAAPTATPPSAVQVPREVSVGRPVQVVSAALGPATAGPAAPNTDTNPLLAETLASPAPTSTGEIGRASCRERV